MSLPRETATRLLGCLEPKQIEAVTVEIARLGIVAPEEQEQVLKEFAHANPAALMGGKGGLEVAKELLEQALGKAAGPALQAIMESVEAIPFAFLRAVDSQNLITFLVDEHPQTIALILSHLRPAQAAEIIRGLPPERQVAVVKRIATMGQTSPDIIHEVEKGLESRMASVMSQRLENAGGVSTVAEILNVVDRATERHILDGLAEEDPDLVNDIRRLMFVFEDITKLSDRDIQTVLKHVDNSQWAMALKGASEELKQKILKNMSSRAATLLQEEMEYLGPVRASNVEHVQQQIVDIIRRLEDAGEITVSLNQEEERLIV